MYGTGYYATPYYATAYYVGSSSAVSGAVLFTYQLLISEARAMLYDTDDTRYRYSDSMMLNALNRGMHELKRVRPDAFYPLYGLYDDYVPEVVLSRPDSEQVDWTTDFQIDLRFYPALVHYVLYAILMQEDASLERAASSLQLFRMFVLST
jgi:hypothetical protein